MAGFFVVVHFETKMKSEHLESCHVEERDISKSAIVETFE